MSSPSILIEPQDTGVLLVKFNRPDALNAFDDEMSYAFQDALKNAEKDKAVRCILITGEGRGFCAGQDLKSRSITSENGAVPHLGESIRKRYAPIISRLRNMEKPTIAMVNGVAAGAGASIAFACDLRIAAQSAKFIQAFVKVGLVPDSGACWLLPRLVGWGRAMELALTGEAINAEKALDWGLVNRVVADESLQEEALALATQMAQGPTKAIGLIKRAMNRAMSMDLDSYLEYEAHTQEIAGRTTDYKEGVAAFMEKRPAQFVGQ
ncbi:MAG TPA: enoyl-CoA hydratase-related protein [Coleofasciculaceae cyanobacterium]|jgi:2-(1,2-epoxy-1,2-dihydrophenyl)acetyl-CoA isomerase